MKRIILISFMILCFNSNAKVNCILDNSCELKTSKRIAKLLGWDEVLDYFDGFEFSTKPIRSSNFDKAYVSSFSNGSLTALILSAEVDGTLKIISTVDVPNHNSFELCDANNDVNEDICLYAFPSGTNVAQYFAQYVQVNGSLISKP